MFTPFIPTKLQALMAELLVLLVLCAAAGAAGWWYGSARTEEKYEKAMLKQQKDAAADSEKLTSERDRLRSEKDAHITAITASLDIAIDKLRKSRAARSVPTPARAECQGASGLELSAEDGEFLAREAARAQRVGAALAECYAAYDQAKDAIDQFNAKHGGQ